MKIDIQKSISSLPINNKKAICSTLPTGQTAKLLVRSNYPVNLTIENIESKFGSRFDDPSYYFGTGGEVLVGA